MSGDAWKAAQKKNKLECDNGWYATMLNVLANNYSYYVLNCGCVVVVTVVDLKHYDLWHESLFLSTEFKLV